jgi:hypothetical protein
MKRAPDQYVLTSADEQGIHGFDNRTRDHSSLNLRVPSEIRREREMVHYPVDRNNVFTVAISGARKGRLGIGREAVDFCAVEARVLNRGAARVNRQQSKRLPWPARNLGITNAGNRGFSFALPHRGLSVNDSHTIRNCGTTTPSSRSSKSTSTTAPIFVRARSAIGRLETISSCGCSASSTTILINGASSSKPATLR